MNIQPKMQWSLPLDISPWFLYKISQELSYLCVRYYITRNGRHKYSESVFKVISSLEFASRNLIKNLRAKYQY